MATTQLPSILISLEIPFVTCESVPVIPHGSMKSLCLSVSWRATRATRELVSYDAWKKRVEKCWEKCCLVKIRYCKSCYSRVFVGLSRWCLFCIEAIGDVSISSLRDFPYMLKGRASAIQSSKNRTIPSDSHVHVSSSKMFWIYFRGSCVNILHC